MRKHHRAPQNEEGKTSAKATFPEKEKYREKCLSIKNFPVSNKLPLRQ